MTNVAALPAVKPAKKSRAARRAPVTARQQRRLGQLFAAAGASFLPIASYVLAHVEAVERPYLWALVAAALAYSAPTVAAWATRWTRSPVKAWGFTVLLEGVLVGSHLPLLNASALAILVAVNAYVAHTNAAGRA